MYRCVGVLCVCIYMSYVCVITCSIRLATADTTGRDSSLNILIVLTFRISDIPVSEEISSARCV